MVHCGFTPSEVNYLQQFSPLYNDVSLRGESAVGVQSKGFFYNPGTARMQVSHLNNSRNPAFVSVLGDLALHGNVRGQGDRHDKGREKKKKSFRERCRFLSRGAELVSSAFLDTEILRLYTDENHGTVHDECVSCKKRRRKKIYLCLCLSLPHLSKSVKYQDTCRAAASKISWIAALVLMFGDLSAAARAVSLCKTCDTITGGHCQAGLSQRVLRKKLRHIFTGE